MIKQLSIFITITVFYISNIESFSIKDEKDSIETLAYVNFKKQHYPEVVNYCTALLKTDSSKSEYFIMIGNAYYYMADYTQAIDNYLKANKLNPSCASYYIAKVYALCGEEKDAIIFLENHLKSKYKLPESEIKLDDDFNRIQQSPLWNELWQKEWYSKREQTLSEINYLIKYKKFNEALDILNNKIDKGWQSHDIYALRGKIFLATGDYKLAVDEYDKAIEKTGYNYEYLYNQAEAAFKSDLNKKALDNYNIILSKEFFRVDILYNKALVLAEQKNYNEAIVCIDRYLSYFNEDNNAIFKAGMIYYEGEKYLGALKYFNKLLAENGYNGDYYMARGETYIKTGTFQYAEADFSMALDLKGDNQQAYLLRGFARYKQNNMEGACHDWHKAKQAGNLQAIIYLQDYCSE